VSWSSACASHSGRIGGRHAAPTTSLPTSRPVLRPATNHVSRSSARASHLGRIGGRDEAPHPSFPTLRPTGNPPFTPPPTVDIGSVQTRPGVCRSGMDLGRARTRGVPHVRLFVLTYKRSTANSALQQCQGSARKMRWTRNDSSAIALLDSCTGPARRQVSDALRSERPGALQSTPRS
jgi:hypothetical protein